MLLFLTNPRSIKCLRLREHSAIPPKCQIKKRTSRRNRKGCPPRGIAKKSDSGVGVFLQANSQPGRHGGLLYPHNCARQLIKLGIAVNPFAQQFVKTNKNDAPAEANCEAVMRPNLRFVPVKATDHQRYRHWIKRVMGFYGSRPTHPIFRQQDEIPIIIPGFYRRPSKMGFGRSIAMR